MLTLISNSHAIADLLSVVVVVLDFAACSASAKLSSRLHPVLDLFIYKRPHLPPPPPQFLPVTLKIPDS